MDIQQLKLLAGHIRALLQQANHPLGHSQSLDLVAAVVGLRNWPEVNSFPARVAAARLDQAAIGRLTYRIKRKANVEVTPEQLLATSQDNTEQRELQVWPTGPEAGVYITTSQAAIDALLSAYDEATDGELVYAESAGQHWKSSIDLGEGGLWSSGLERVPSGTLLVVGPLDLCEESWEDSRDRLQAACTRAQLDGHRVAVLVRTPSPDTLHFDLDRLVRSADDSMDEHEALLGDVLEDGRCVRRIPFANELNPPAQAPFEEPISTISASALQRLQPALAACNSGLVLVGSDVEGEHHAMELIVACLSLTNRLGPVARVRPRSRGTPAKDWLVPESIKTVPFLPSVQSAYEQGYRRIIFPAYYTDAEVLLRYGRDALLITGSHGTEVTRIFLQTVRGRGSDQEREILKLITATLGVSSVSSHQIADLYTGGSDIPSFTRGTHAWDFMEQNRTVRREDEALALLRANAIQPQDLIDSLGRDHDVRKLLEQHGYIVPSDAADQK